MGSPDATGTGCPTGCLRPHRLCFMTTGAGIGNFQANSASVPGSRRRREPGIGRLNLMTHSGLWQNWPLSLTGGGETGAEIEALWAGLALAWWVWSFLRFFS